MPRITFLPSGVVADAVAGATVLEAAHGAGVEIKSACGGVGACGSCHIIIRCDAGGLEPASDREEEVLEKASGLTLNSRLACMAKVTGDVTVEIPG